MIIGSDLGDCLNVCIHFDTCIGLDPALMFAHDFGIYIDLVIDIDLAHYIGLDIGTVLGPAICIYLGCHIVIYIY